MSGDVASEVLRSAQVGETGTLIANTHGRVRGLVFQAAATAGSVVLKDGGAGGATILTLNTPASAAAIADVHVPGGGISFGTDLHATLSNVSAVTVLYARDGGSLQTVDLSVSVLKTGQSVAYPVSGRTAKDDGTLGLGTVRSYTVSDAGQYSGNTFITVGTVSGAVTNNVVSDNVTGLMWAREHHPTPVVWDDSGGSDEDAYALVDEANAQSLGGHTDWRLPNLFELTTLWLAGNSSPCIDTSAFPNWGTAYVWSSTTDHNNSNNAIRVYFDDMRADPANKTTATNTYAAFVRTVGT